MNDSQELHPLDAKRIAVENADEVRAWCKSLGCREQDLKKAVRVVGTSEANIRKYLSK